MDTEINKRIRAYRKKAKLTQGETAEALGLKCSTYSQMERKGAIKADIAIKLATVFNVDPDLIIYGEKKIDFSPLEPTILRAKEPETFYQKLLESQENLKSITDKKQDDFPLINREKQAITIIRNLSDKDREDVYAYIEKKHKKR